MFCTTCGAKNNEEAKFCTVCGAALGTASAAPPPPPYSEPPQNTYQPPVEQPPYSEPPQNTYQPPVEQPSYSEPPQITYRPPVEQPPYSEPQQTSQAPVEQPSYSEPPQNTYRPPVEQPPYSEPQQTYQAPMEQPPYNEPPKYTYQPPVEQPPYSEPPQQNSYPSVQNSEFRIPNPPPPQPIYTGKSKGKSKIWIPIVAGVVVLLLAFAALVQFTDIFGEDFLWKSSGSGNINKGKGEIPDGGGRVKVEEETEFTFTPDTSGSWEIYTSGNGESDPVLTLYDRYGDIMMEDDNSGRGSNAQIIAKLDADETYTILAGFIGDVYNGYSLNVELVPEVEETQETEETQTPSIKEASIPRSGGELRVEEETMFSFSPNTSGMWEIATSDNGRSDPVLTVFNQGGYIIAYDDDSAGDRNAWMVVELRAGDTYTIHAAFQGQTQGSYTLTVELIPETTTGTIPSDGGTVNVTGLTIFEFKPIESAIWEIYSWESGDSDPMLWIYDEYFNIIDYNDDDIFGTDAKLVIYLEGGETYYVEAGFYDGGTGSYSLSAWSYEIIPGDGGELQASYYGSYAFIPNESGIWEFRTSSSGNTDPQLWIFDTYYEIFENDDNGAGGLDALITMYLEEGEVYFVNVTITEGNSTTLIVTKQ